MNTSVYIKDPNIVFISSGRIITSFPGSHLAEGCVTVLGGHTGREPIPQGKHWYSHRISSKPRWRIRDCPGLRRISSAPPETVKHPHMKVGAVIGEMDIEYF
jgi:hypothetical protein